MYICYMNRDELKEVLAPFNLRKVEEEVGLGKGSLGHYLRGERGLVGLDKLCVWVREHGEKMYKFGAPYVKPKHGGYIPKASIPPTVTLPVSTKTKYRLYHKGDFLYFDTESDMNKFKHELKEKI